MEKYTLSLFAFVAVILFGCRAGNDGGESGSLPGGSVTLWTAKSELFMEYPALIVGQESRFAVHLTWLTDFKPVIEGTLTLRFVSRDGHSQETTSHAPTSPGIFRPTISFAKPGTYRLDMFISGMSDDTLVVTDLKVWESGDSIMQQDESTGEQMITFLKEQQWKIDFRTEPVMRQGIYGTVRAVCEVLPKLNSEAVVSAPFSGSITVAENPRLPVVGQQITKGDHLAVLVPSAETPGGMDDFASRFSEAETARELAEKELERAGRLRAIDGISEKEFQEAEAAFKRADATYRLLSKSVRPSTKGGSRPDGGFTLFAPLSGTLIEADVVPGKHVNAGDQLYRIIDTRSVWIRGNVISTEIGRLARPQRAWLRLAGTDDLLEIHKGNGRLVSMAKAIDAGTRSFPVIFEVQNRDGRLRIGMFGEILIATGEEKNAMVVPESALMEEEGRYSVYVHVEGEAFAKRTVTLGERNGQYVEILNGVTEGERVVTVGAYHVRLASLSAQVPAHGHEH